MYHRHCVDQNGQPRPLESLREGELVLPVNTHGGLLSFGAPWETPAMYNIIEAVEQLNGTAHGRQVKDAKRALVYGFILPRVLPHPHCSLSLSVLPFPPVGNGGIFSASAVAILGNGRY
jgi:hypothetical protein